LRTYVYYSRQVIFDIVCAKDGVSRDSFDYERYSDNLSMIDKIQQMIELNKNFYGIRDKIMNAYGDSYKK